jgi:predicted metal-dependent phosphoesterase TrpH
MKLDLHIHSKYSYDSFSEPSKIVKMAKRRGLDVISITDHDNMKVYEKLPHKLDIIVVRGMEKKTDMGDVTGLFLNISHGHSFIVSRIKRRVL